MLRPILKSVHKRRLETRIKAALENWAKDAEVVIDPTYWAQTHQVRTVDLKAADTHFDDNGDGEASAEVIVVFARVRVKRKAKDHAVDSKSERCSGQKGHQLAER